MFNKAHFDQLLQRMLEKGASDLHLSSNEHPFFREDGRLIRQDDLYSTAAELEQVALDVLNVNQQAVFTQHQQVDVAIAYGMLFILVECCCCSWNVTIACGMLR